MDFIVNKLKPENEKYNNVLSYARFIKSFKFLAYSNEVGETIRHTFPKLIIPAYCLSFGYIFSDIFHHCFPFYDENGWCEETKKSLYNRLLWHSTASLIFPTLTIGASIKTTKWIMIKSGCKIHTIRWTLPLVGIGMIPFIIKPIDDFTEKYIMKYIEE